LIHASFMSPTSFKDLSRSGRRRPQDLRKFAASEATV
jgi:hypothetical protein